VGISTPWFLTGGPRGTIRTCAACRIAATAVAATTLAIQSLASDRASLYPSTTQLT